MTEPRPPIDVLPHRPPFLMIDEVVECDAERVLARRTFRADEAFFAGHFPDQPIVPGVLLVEGMAQALAYLALKGRPAAAVYLAGIDRARFRKPVVPGETVEFEVRIEGERLGLLTARAEARVNGARVADATLNGHVAEETPGS